MSGSRKQILIHFTGRKKRKARNKTREKFMSEEKIQNLAETTKGQYYNQEECLEEFLDDKGAIYNDTEVATRGLLQEKVFLKILANVTEKHLCWSLLSIKLQTSGLQLY